MNKSLLAIAAAAILLATPALSASSVPDHGSITGTTVPSGLCLNTVAECEAFLVTAAANGSNGSITGTLVPSGLCGNGNEQACLDWLAARS